MQRGLVLVSVNMVPVSSVAVGKTIFDDRTVIVFECHVAMWCICRLDGSLSHGNRTGHHSMVDLDLQNQPLFCT
ncbi:hypothetical protein V8B97DRAFT_1951119 [Scleroderma yunnanense]